MEITWTKGAPIVWWEDFMMYGSIFVIVFCVVFMTQEMIRIHREDKRLYKERWNEDGSPNRPGAWGIQ